MTSRIYRALYTKNSKFRNFLWWMEGKWDDALGPFRRFKYGCSNLLKFGKLLWQWRWWDYSYTMTLSGELWMEQGRQLRAKGHSLSREKDGRRALIIGRLMKDINAKDYWEGGYTSKYSFDGWKIGELPEGGSFRLSCRKDTKQQEYAYKRKKNIEAVRINNDWETLISYMRKYAAHIWD